MSYLSEAQSELLQLNTYKNKSGAKYDAERTLITANLAVAAELAEIARLFRLFCVGNIKWEDKFHMREALFTTITPGASGRFDDK